MPASFRLYPKIQSFYGQSGQLLAGGELRFYTAGTTTPKSVYGEKALTTNNGTTMPLDAAGRPENAIWGSGQYDVKLYDADGVEQGEDLLVEIPGGEATALPALSTDKFLTNDGAVMSWATVRQVPNPLGHTGDFLSTDGTSLTWVGGPETPEVPDLPITVTTGGVIFGTAGSDFTQILYNADTITASGARTASKTVTFASAFNAAPVVTVSPTGTAPTNGSDIFPSFSITAVSTTAFTVKFSTLTGGTSADSSSSNSVIANTLAFNWQAIGPVDEP